MNKTVLIILSVFTIMLFQNCGEIDPNSATGAGSNTNSSGIGSLPDLGTGTGPASGNLNSCGNTAGDLAYRGYSENINAALINLPTSISSTSSSKISINSVSINSIDSATKNIFDVIRYNVGIAKSTADEVASQVALILSPSYPYRSSFHCSEGYKFITSLDPDSYDASAMQCQMNQNDGGTTYQYKVTSYFGANFNNAGYITYYTIDGSHVYGKMKTSLDAISNFTATNFKKEITYDNQKPGYGKWLELKLDKSQECVGDDVNNELICKPTRSGVLYYCDLNVSHKIWIEAYSNDNNLITINGVIYYPYIDFYSLPSKFSGGYRENCNFIWYDRNNVNNYARSYVFTAIADNENNVALANLAVIPSNLNTNDLSTIFSQYSIRDRYNSNVANEIRNDASVCNWFNYLNTQCSFSNNTLDGNSSIGNVISALNTFLDNLNTAQPCSDLVSYDANNMVTEYDYINNLVNPAYFNSNGFLGTASHNTPSTGYDDFMPFLVNANMSLIPEEIIDMSIVFE